MEIGKKTAEVFALLQQAVINGLYVRFEFLKAVDDIVEQAHSQAGIGYRVVGFFGDQFIIFDQFMIGIARENQGGEVEAIDKIAAEEFPFYLVFLKDGQVMGEDIMAAAIACAGGFREVLEFLYIGVMEMCPAVPGADIFDP